MPYCVGCGFELQQDWNACANCGKLILDETKKEIFSANDRISIGVVEDEDMKSVSHILDRLDSIENKIRIVAAIWLSITAILFWHIFMYGDYYFFLDDIFLIGSMIIIIYGIYGSKFMVRLRSKRLRIRSKRLIRSRKNAIIPTESSTNNSRRPRSAIARWASRNLTEEQLEGKPQPEPEPELREGYGWIDALVFIVPLILYIIGRGVLADLQ
tara:strand:+ start:105 stop:743 length:639 start_codon:yes stop_codon:yes gene_type:complete